VDVLRVLRGLLVDRRRGVQLAALERQPDEVLVVLQHVELQVVAGQHPDAVDVALGDVLELPRVLAQLEHDLEAVEGALELAGDLEVVGDLLEPALRLDQRAPGLGRRRVEPRDRRADVEVHQRLLVRTIAQRRVGRQRLPPRPRLVVDLGLVPRDRGVGRPPGLGPRGRGVGPPLLDLGQPRAQLGRRGQAGLGLIEVVQVQVDEPGLAAAAQVAIAVGQAAQPVVVLVVDDVGLGDQLAERALGLGVAARGHRLLRRRRRGLDRVEAAPTHGPTPGRPRPPGRRAASLTMSSARRCRPWRVAKISGDTTWWRASDATKSGSASVDGLMMMP
jgi:hypothetical protein